MQLVDQTRPQVLAEGRDTSSETHIPSSCGGSRLLQGCVNALGDEPELGSARHPDRCARVMREDKNRNVIRGLSAPPSLPALVRPGTPHRTKHVPAENPGTHSGETLFGDSVIDSTLAAILALHPAPHARVEKPLEQLRTAHPEGILQILTGSRAVAIE